MYVEGKKIEFFFLPHQPVHVYFITKTKRKKNQCKQLENKEKTFNSNILCGTHFGFIVNVKLRSICVSSETPNTKSHHFHRFVNRINSRTKITKIC